MKTSRLLPLLTALPLALLPTTAQTARPRVKAVDPTPATARPQGATALSTAETGGARDGKRLRSLPGLTATQADGTPVQVGTLPHPDYWLLLYRGLKCVPCDQVMDALGASGDAAMRTGSGLVVLVDGGKAASSTSASDLHNLLSRYSTMTGAVWLNDRQGQALATLKPTGQPILYAMHGSSITWSAPGRLGDGKTLATLASSWIARNPPPAASSAEREK